MLLRTTSFWRAENGQTGRPSASATRLCHEHPGKPWRIPHLQIPSEASVASPGTQNGRGALKLNNIFMQFSKLWLVGWLPIFVNKALLE